MSAWINVVGVVVTAALLAALYIAKTDASSAQDRLARLQAELAEERGRINTLTANIAHLEDPEHLRELARAHLGFEPARPSQEILLSDLPRVDPEDVEEDDEADARADDSGVARARVVRPGGGAGR
ncbi:hypothetical protein DDZ18_08700 [Marinicauda salina]|uniref:Cell division protein FtsL n=1 Tax=Marinicauda salina TaxID=2135793 RepID=A0A2U2BUT6_9PROT|nr:hypothetical protein [Marinicauda salina]PWE17724.1 hypothetical protein DDZ18_08700 [Marinicauda salina]